MNASSYNRRNKFMKSSHFTWVDKELDFGGVECKCLRTAKENMQGAKEEP